MFGSLDDLCIGKTISLEKAAKLLSEVDGGDLCQRWTLRFCLSKYVKTCIKLPSPVLTWEREKEPDYGISCGKCSEISDQIYEARMNDIDDDDIPSYCENCQMTKMPTMGIGDYIDRRTGVLFLPHQAVEEFTYSDIDEVSYSRFYVRDDAWSSGFKEVEIASERHYLEFIYKEELEEPPVIGGYLHSQGSMRNSIESASTDSYLPIGIENLFVWKDDFEEALEGDDDQLSIRQDQPMSKTINNLHRRPVQQKQWMMQYMKSKSLLIIFLIA